MCQGGSVGIGQSKVSGRSCLWILRRILDLRRILEPDGTEQREARWEAAKSSLEGGIAFTDCSVLLLGRVLEDILEQRGGCRQRSVKVGPGLGAQRAHELEHFAGGHLAPNAQSFASSAWRSYYRSTWATHSARVFFFLIITGRRIKSRNHRQSRPNCCARFAMAFAGGPMAFSSRAAVLRHAKPLAVARPEARLAGLVAALVVTFSGSLQPLAGNFLQDEGEKKAAESRRTSRRYGSRVEPVYMSAKSTTRTSPQTDFKSDLLRPSRTSQRFSVPHCRTRPRQPKTDPPRCLESQRAAVSMPMAGAASTPARHREDLGVANRIAKFQSVEKEKERALVSPPPTPPRRSSAQRGGRAAAANLAETTGGVKASLASDKALKALKEDHYKGSERYNAAVAKAQQADLDAIQAQTKAVLSEQFAAVSDATAEAASRTAAGVSKQVETAGESDLAKSASSVALPKVEVAAPDIGSRWRSSRRRAGRPRQGAGGVGAGRGDDGQGLRGCRAGRGGGGRAARRRRTRRRRRRSRRRRRRRCSRWRCRTWGGRRGQKAEVKMDFEP